MGDFQRTKAQHGRRRAWMELSRLTTGILLTEWLLGSAVAWRPDGKTALFGGLAVLAAAAVQAALFGDRLFPAHEARMALSDSRRIATMVGRVFFDARHILAFRDRSRTGQVTLLFAAFVLTPAFLFVRTRLGIDLPLLMILSMVTLALAMTPGFFRVSVGLSGLALIFAAPRGTALWVDVALCLVGGLGLLTLSWRQAVTDDTQRFADIAKRPPLSRLTHGLRGGAEFLIAGMVAAALLPRPERWQAPRKSDVALVAPSSAQGGGGQKKPTPKEASEEGSDEKEKEEKESEAVGEGVGEGSGSDSGQGGGKGQGAEQGGAPNVGPRSDGDHDTGKIKIAPQNDRRRKLPRQVPWLVTFVVALLFLAFLGMRRKMPREPRSPKGPPPPRRQEREASRQDLIRALRQVKTIPQPDRAAVIALYNGLLAYMARGGTPKEPGETPDEFARRWTHSYRGHPEDTRIVTGIFSRAYYGQKDPSTDEFARFLEASTRLAEPRT